MTKASADAVSAATKAIADGLVAAGVSPVDAARAAAAAVQRAVDTNVLVNGLPAEKSAKTPEYSVEHHPLGTEGLWHHEGLQLPAYIQNVAKGLMESGHPREEAIPMAIGAVKRWAAGGGKVTPEVRAAAGKAVGEWEALKASHGKAILAVLEKAHAGDAGPKVFKYRPEQPRGPHGRWVRITDEPPAEYRGSHQPNVEADDVGASADHLDDVVATHDVYDHPGYYTGYPHDQEMLAQLRRARGNPEATLTAYRAIPSNATPKINPGDWISLSRQYAVQHGEGPLGGDYQIVTQPVKAKEVWWPGDDLEEYGYKPEGAGI